MPDQLKHSDPRRVQRPDHGRDAFQVAMIRAAARMADLLDEIEVADCVGLDVFGIGEHHRPEFLDSAPTVILAAATPANFSSSAAT